MNTKLRKHLLPLLFVAALIVPVAPLVLTSCTTSQQRLAFNSIATLETATTTAVDGYFLLVVDGKVSTNGVPSISKAYNKFQGGVLVALDLVQNNTNALAPSSLQQLSADVISLVSQFRKGN